MPLPLAACAPGTKHQGCVPSYQTPDFARLETELATARRRWAQAGISSYSYLPQINNFGTMSSRGSGGSGGDQPPVVVQGGQVQGEQDGNSDPTMEGHFQYLASEIAVARSPQSCLLIDAAYDPTDGHVLSYMLDDVKVGLMDAFGGVTLRDFRRKN